MQDLTEIEFGTLAALIHQHAVAEPARPALVAGSRTVSYAELDGLMDQVASALQRDCIGPGHAIAICASMSVAYAVVFLGALRAGVAVAPLAPGSTPQSLARMVDDAQARLVFTDSACAAELHLLVQAAQPVPVLALDDLDLTRLLGQPASALAQWLAAPGTQPHPVAVQPDWPFNIIYSSGTTGEPKGIVQSHGMRWTHVRRGSTYGYGPRTVTLVATPLYSNTTLVVFFPTLAFGGCAVLMPKFDALRFLQLAQDHRATHAMLVPVQYQRLMARPEFDGFDLSAFTVKFSTSAPFSGPLKADVLQRWPGGLVEFYGMTEGGGTCILEAHLHPTKLHTVGLPAEGHDIRLIDEQGDSVPQGQSGEVVGHSPGMMLGYHGQPAKTREAEWFDATGKRFIRTGDVGRFDAEGFLTLMDRKKDMIISGGFNIYPSDLESVLREHGAVHEAAVVGVPSVQWGESPVAYVVLKPQAAPLGAGADAVDAAALLYWVNARVGKTQRLLAVRVVAELPRSAIGKVLKRELRDLFTMTPV